MKKLVQGVHKFRSQAFEAKRELFAGLARGQQPHTLFITCSDSRINPSLLTQTDPGELFILRNPGNLVPSNAAPYSGEAAGIEYALGALSIEHIVVCGHSHCGAMNALVSPAAGAQYPAMGAWLQHADATRRILSENYNSSPAEDQLNLAIQENVLVQLENLRSYPMVAQRMDEGRLHLYGWVYKLETGEVFSFDVETGQFEAMGGKSETGITATELPRITTTLSL